MSKESSKKLTKLAGRVVRNGRCSKREAQALAGSVLVQFEHEQKMTMAQAFAEWRRMAEEFPKLFEDAVNMRSQRRARAVGRVDAELLTDLMRDGKKTWDERNVDLQLVPVRRARRRRRR